MRPATATDACRRDIARQLLAALRRIDAQLNTNETELSQAVTAAGSSLTELKRRWYSDYLHREYGALDSDYVFVNLFAEPRGRPWGYPAVYDLVRRLRNVGDA